MSKKRKSREFREGMAEGAKAMEEQVKNIASDAEKTQEAIKQMDDGMHGMKKTQTQLFDVVEEEKKRCEECEKGVRRNEQNIEYQRVAIDFLKESAENAVQQCYQCGNSVDVKQMICENCGSIVALPYELSELKIDGNRCLAAVKDISESIKSTTLSGSYCIYSEFKEKFLKMKKIQVIAEKEFEKTKAKIYKDIANHIKVFFEYCGKQKIEIALVGTVKAGKSSLINALTGEKLASVAATPETSVLIKYKTTKENNYLKIKFYSQKQWKRIWEEAKNIPAFKDEYDKTNAEQVAQEYLGKADIEIVCEKSELSQEIMKWTSSDSPRHFFVSEIEVAYQNDAFAHDIYLVDTPGLDDKVEYRSDITKKYIKKSDQVLFCIQADRVNEGTVVDDITRLIQNKNNEKGSVIILATKRDILMTKEWKAKRSLFLKYLHDIYSGNQEAEQHLIAVSAELQTLSNKYINGISLTEDETEQLASMLPRIKANLENIQEYCNEIEDYSGIKMLRDRLNTMVVQQRFREIKKNINATYNYSMEKIRALSNDYISRCDQQIKQIIEIYTDKTQNTKDIQREIETLNEKNARLNSLRKELQSEFKNKIAIL